MLVGLVGLYGGGELVGFWVVLGGPGLVHFWGESEQDCSKQAV